MANHRLKKEDYDRRISELYNEELESLDFETTKHPVTVRCKKCGYTQRIAKAATLIYNPRGERKGFCPNCREKRTNNTWTHQTFLEEVQKRNTKADNYIFLNTYINRETIMKVQCKECGKIYERYARAFLSNKGDCPYCGEYKKSSGEKIIRQYLEEKNINYETQYILKEFDHRKSFDFKIILSEKLFFLIEYDGIQHFQYNEFLHRGDYNLFLQQQKYDEMKNKYCEENGINLLRIPYTEKNNINIILDNYIKQLKEGSTTIPQGSTL